jgi:hypothetical protein
MTIVDIKWDDGQKQWSGRRRWTRNSRNHSGGRQSPGGKVAWRPEPAFASFACGMPLHVADHGDRLCALTVSASVGIRYFGFRITPGRGPWPASVVVMGRMDDGVQGDQMMQDTGSAP